MSFKIPFIISIYILYKINYKALELINSEISFKMKSIIPLFFPPKSFVMPWMLPEI